MTTIPFRAGDSAVWLFELSDGTGQPVDMTGAVAWVEVHGVTACARLPLDPADGGFAWRMTDETMPDLPARAYGATLVIEWPDGLRDRDDFTLLIEEGC